MFNQKEYYKNNKKARLKYAKKYREENKEIISIKYREWRKKNPEYGKNWRENNREYILKCNRNWKKTEKGKACKQRDKTKRRIRMRRIINTLTAEEWLDILKEFKYKCAYCGKEFNLFNLPTKDHIIPLSKGGDNTKENILPACMSCNSKKRARILVEN